MIDRILRLVIVLFTATGGFLLMQWIFPYIQSIVESEIWKIGWLGVRLSTVLTLLFGGFIGGICGYFLAPLLISRLWEFTYWLERKINQMSIADMIVGSVGMIVGLIMANLFGLAVYHLPFIGDYIPIILSVIFAYVGLNVSIRKREDINQFFTRVGWIKNKEDLSAALRLDYKILDTSVIIDGRIVDLSRTGFLEGVLVVPQFVLAELQHIADSSDGMKRNRGRRGLDVLNLLQKEQHMEVRIEPIDFDDISEVDAKLVRLGQEMGGKVLTNDYNLNKVAEFQGVKVLNINELANAIKPILLPGEEMTILVMKEGKESSQGIGYLDDGTMVVVEAGRALIGQTIDVVVTSVLQTAAGRMIFVRPK